MPMEPVRVGVIGAGDISAVYLNAIDRSPAVELRRVATRRADRAQEIAARFGATGSGIVELLEDDSIELVVNLTPGIAHEPLNAAIIDAGKHVYCEKPFALTSTMAEEIADNAARSRLLIGSAPDTFYGSAHQAARRAFDSGAIGREVFGMSFIGVPGLEKFHPNPEAFYRPGGEPPFDIGPYYIAMWINLLGPVKRVHAASGSGRQERVIQRGPRTGTRFAVEVDSTFNAILEFATASVSLILSLDAAVPCLRPGELFGCDGLLELADPMFFSGKTTVTAGASGKQLLDANGLAFSQPNRLNHFGDAVADYRGVGVIDLALAIRHGTRHHTAADFVVHSVEVMEAIKIAATDKRVVTLRTTCERPMPLDSVTDAKLIMFTASPFDFDQAGKTTRD